MKKRTKLSKLAIGAVLSVLAGVACAQAGPVGLWKTIDEKTKVERSQVRISESGGVLSGRIEKLPASGMADAKCDKCEDDRKGQNIVGLEIIRGLKKGDGDTWDGGTILDPADGKVYKVRLTPADGGKKLDVRGYIGTPMLGRTQTWVRAD